MRSPRRVRGAPVGYGFAVALLAGPVLTGDADAHPQPAAPIAGGVRFLNIRRPALVQRFDARGRDIERLRFVRIRVVAVRNPRLTGVTFNVDFRANSGASIHLGSFSLYPADNPGTFIVPFPRGAVLPGSVAVSFHTTDKVDPVAPPVIGIGAIDLIEDEGTFVR